MWDQAVIHSKTFFYISQSRVWSTVTVPCWRAQWSGQGSCVKRGRSLSEDAPWLSGEDRTHTLLLMPKKRKRIHVLCFTACSAQAKLALVISCSSLDESNTIKLVWPLYLDDTDESFRIFLEDRLEGCSWQLQDGGRSCSSRRHCFVRCWIALIYT